MRQFRKCQKSFWLKYILDNIGAVYEVTDIIIQSYYSAISIMNGGNQVQQFFQYKVMS